MKITLITPTDESGNRQIFVDDELFCSLPSDVVMRLDLHTGDEYDEGQTEALLLRVESIRVLEKAYSLLSYGDYSRKKVGEKLRRYDYSDGAVELTLDRLEELGLINDEALAERLVKVMRDTKHWGLRRAVNELYQRGFTAQTVENAVAEYDEMPGLLYQIEHKIDLSALGEVKGREKAVAKLVRMGFSYDNVRSALRDFEEEY